MGVTIYVGSITSINYTVDMGTVFQKMYHISDCSYIRCWAFSFRHISVTR